MAEINSTQDVASILQPIQTQSRQQESASTTVKPITQSDEESTVQSSLSAKNSEEALSVTQQVAQQQLERIEEIKESLEKLNEFIPIRSTNLIFEFDELGDPPVIKVVDRDSEEVIREIPPREFRDIAKALEEFADKLDNRGVFFNQSA